MPKWLICAVLTMACFGAWGVVYAKALEHMSALQNQVLSTLGLVPVALFLCRSGNLKQGSAKARGSLYALIAGLITGIGNIFYGVALSQGGKASTVIALTAVYPLVTVVLALAFLREKLDRIQVGGILLALVAMYLCNVGGETGLVSPWLAYSLIPIALWGITGLFQKLMTAQVSGELGTLVFLAAFVPIAGIILLLEPASVSWGMQPMDWGIPAEGWLYAVLGGALYGFGNLSLIVAFAAGGKATVVTPLSGLYPIVGVPLALLFLHDPISGRESVGILLSLAAVWSLSRERGTDGVPHPVPQGSSEGGPV
jgi:transporter family protein